MLLKASGDRSVSMALIKQTDNLKEENKMKKKTIVICRTKYCCFLQINDQAVAIHSAPSKDFIVSNLEPVSAHTILAGTLNVKVDLKENASYTPKKKTQKIMTLLIIPYYTYISS